MLKDFDVTYEDKYLFEFYDWLKNVAPMGLRPLNPQSATKMPALRA